jgi:hypothetical protein
VTARPNTSTAKEGAMADKREPISKRRMEKRKVCFAGRKV